MKMLFKDSLKLCSIIFIFAVILTSIVNNLHLDITVATWAYDSSSSFARFIRDDTMNPIIVLSLIFLTSAIAIKKYDINFGNVKTFRQVCLVWVAVVLLGSALIVNGILKPFVERPRPKDTIILQGDYEFRKPIEVIGTTGGMKSFPSGHASMGFLFLAPFFLLYLKRHYKLSATFLGLGLTFGCIIGYGRIVIGAHFLTDVIWSGTIMSILSILCAHWVLAKTEDNKQLFKSRKNMANLTLKNA
jgi:membrane-associated PAP2 superfamily phosphatase